MESEVARLLTLNAKPLIDQGAKVDIESEWGETALDISRRGGLTSTDGRENVNPELIMKIESKLQGVNITETEESGYDYAVPPDYNDYAARRRRRRTPQDYYDYGGYDYPDYNDHSVAVAVSAIDWTRTIWEKGEERYGYFTLAIYQVKPSHQYLTNFLTD